MDLKTEQECWETAEQFEHMGKLVEELLRTATLLSDFGMARREIEDLDLTPLATACHACHFLAAFVRMWPAYLPETIGT